MCGAPDEDAETGVQLEPCVNEKVTVRGSAIYRIASYLNHSCDPNVMALYPHLAGHVTAFVAGKSIKKDDELFYRYPLPPQPKPQARVR
jgi:hypothetical protein